MPGKACPQPGQAFARLNCTLRKLTQRAPRATGAARNTRSPPGRQQRLGKHPCCHIFGWFSSHLCQLGVTRPSDGSQLAAMSFHGSTLPKAQTPSTPSATHLVASSGLRSETQASEAEMRAPNARAPDASLKPKRPASTPTQPQSKQTSNRLRPHQPASATPAWWRTSSRPR